MRLEERKFVRLGLLLGAVAAVIPVVYVLGVFIFGLSIAPRPAVAAAAAPPLVKDALWARAEGGRATELRSINPISMAGYIACNEMSERGTDCSRWLPAVPGLEYLATRHLEASGIKRHSFRGGAGSMATMVRMTRAFSRDDFLNTLAAHAEFDGGWRGVEAAAQGFFGRPAASLTLAHAALLASRIGDLTNDPWCHPADATDRRNRILRLMRDNGAIDDAAMRAASAAPLALTGPRPASLPPCTK